MPKILVVAVVATVLFGPRSSVSAEFKAGAAVTDVTPISLPVKVNGSLAIRKVGRVKTPLSARAIVLDDGTERLAIVVVDNCMMPRTFLDETKLRASRETKLKPNRILISATHTHSAPSVMDIPPGDAEESYLPYLRKRIVEAIATAERNLEPAQVGWALANAAQFTALRRWIRRPDRIEKDPFGNRTVRATMHAASNWDNVTGESGPEDPDLAMISIQARDGRPLAVMANFSMHYFSGEVGLSADYYGLFCEGLKARLPHGKDRGTPPFVGIMSHGCSGDIWRRDYALPPDRRPNWKIDEYSKQFVDLAVSALKSVKYRHDVDLAMAERRMKLNYRVPDAQRLKWAREIVDAMPNLSARNRNEFYAVQQVLLHERQATEIVVQALRIGDIGIATTPNETYALTGLKVKLQSPLTRTFVIELANGADGYIPPPEQHLLGGYNTWPARSAGLEVEAEPKITETALALLERVSGTPRRTWRQARGAGADAIAAAKPTAWWRMDEFAAPHAADSSGHANDGMYEPGVAFFLDGPHSNLLSGTKEPNRAAHFAGGRLRARTRPRSLDGDFSVSIWFWNGMPTNGREVTGWMFSRGHNHGLGAGSEHLGLGGTAGHAGRLIYQRGDDSAAVAGGKTEIQRWSWNHVVLVHSGKKVRIHLNGQAEPEIEMNLQVAGRSIDELFLGGRSDGAANWEGRLDEVALFNRALTPAEIKTMALSE
ncbi:MAG: LamG-like jellyroll fold domain-containing protein [Planctomycetota bacterium]|nr:LamG-like jellyroll fold domain-containing protein [Planctomycetota bacterium]